MNKSRRAQKSPAQIAYDVAISKAWKIYMDALKIPCQEFQDAVKKARQELEATR